MKCVYVIPCSCGIPYVTETQRSINQRVHERATGINHRRTETLALEEHAEKTKHHICIEEAKVIAKIVHFHHRKFRDPLKLKGGRAISIGMMDGILGAVGFLPLPLSPPLSPRLQDCVDFPSYCLVAFLCS